MRGNCKGLILRQINTSILRKFAFPVSFTLADYDKELAILE
jgi:hypothetical protein